VKQLIACAALITCLSLAGSGQSGNAAALGQVKNVYFLPMSRGLDQYLANRLTGGGFLQVVTDPSKADALFTDHLDAAFEASVKELYPETKPVVAPAKSADKPKEAKPPVAEATPDASEMKMSGGERPPTVARSRGTVFLVKRGTGNILWSVYHDPSIRRPKELDQAAGKIVAALKKAMAAASPAKSGGK
jgi:hypothetical protein